MAVATGSPPVLLEDRVVDLTADQFLGMAEAGLFPNDSRVYLWGGRIVEKMAKSQPHATTAIRVVQALRRRLSDDWLISPENPVRLDDRHVPLPDFAIVRGPVEVYERERRHPLAGDVGLVIEVAYSSLVKDLGPRAEVFARAGVPVYWVLDVVGLRVVEHSGARVVDGVGSYENVRTLDRGDELRLTLDGREAGVIPVRDLLP